MGLGRDAGEHKYIPPSFDPRNLPKMEKSTKGTTTRIMMPMGVQCDSCGEWIARDKKFLSVKEKTGKFYLEEPIIRLKIRCPRCHGEIAITTDPEKRGYNVEYGAHRLYQHYIWEQDKKEKEEAELEKGKGDQLAEHNQKVAQTQKEMSDLEQLEELQFASSARFAVTEEQLLNTTLAKHENKKTEQEEAEEDRLEAERVFKELANKKAGGGSRGSGDVGGEPPAKKRKIAEPTPDEEIAVAVSKKDKKEKKKKKSKKEGLGGLFAGYGSD